MNKEDWEIVKIRLERLYTPIKLNCDGYELTLILVRDGQFSNYIQFYVNGKFRLEWFNEDCEERRRFFRKSERSRLNSKSRAELKKLKTSKKRMKELEERAKYIIYDPMWKSFNSLKKHLIANNENIELVEMFEY